MLKKQKKNISNEVCHFEGLRFEGVIFIDLDHVKVDVMSSCSLNRAFYLI